MSDPINDAEAYGVRIVPCQVAPGTSYWRVIRVHHLTPAENAGKHHLFLDALDPQGNRLFGTRLLVRWEGGSREVVIDKPLPEPGANEPLWKWQVVSVEALGMPSDRVENLHTGHPDEGPGNTLFHHSFAVTFQQAVAAAPQPSPGAALSHYVLFGPLDRPDTRLYLDLLAGYLAQHELSFGFDPAAAAKAARVSLVGEHATATRELLTAAGCQVEEWPRDPAALAAWAGL
jgi:hypothetical protein